MKRMIAGLLLLISTGSWAWADVVTLKNGDRVTGTLVNVKDGTLQFKADILGALSIPLDKVATFSAAKPVAVLIKGEKPVQGTLAFKPDGNWEVTADGKAQTIVAAKVDVIMPADEYQTLIVEAPKPWEAWKGGVAVGYSVSRGNQDTSTITTTINAVRERPEAPIFQTHQRTTFSLTTILSHATQDSINLTAHTLSTGVREDFLFTPDNFVFGLAQLDHVSTQGLYLRQTYGGGLGHSFVKTSKTNFSVLGGLTVVHEKFFDGISDQTGALLVGEVLGKQFNKRVRLDHNLNFYPNLSNTGQYRFDTSTVLSVKLRAKLSLNTTLIDLFLSNPPAGNQRNNIALSLGIGYSF